jgi:hypothetical protein
MRSGLISAVSEKINNRYVLCRMLAVSARRMHRDGVSISQSITRSLQLLNQQPSLQTPFATEAPQPAENLPETEAAVAPAP